MWLIAKKHLTKVQPSDKFHDFRRTPHSSRRSSGAGGQEQVDRSRWSGAGGQEQVVRSRWSEAGGQEQVVRVRWSGAGRKGKACSAADPVQVVCHLGVHPRLLRPPHTPPPTTPPPAAPPLRPPPPQGTRLVIKVTNMQWVASRYYFCTNIFSFIGILISTASAIFSISIFTSYDFAISNMINC